MAGGLQASQALLGGSVVVAVLGLKEWYILAVFAPNGIVAVVGVITGVWLGIETKGKILEEIAA